MRYHELADRWNESHPPGTPVLVQLADGRTVEDATAGDAIGWGSLALVRLQGRPGMWATTMLIPQAGADCRLVTMGREQVLLRS